MKCDIIIARGDLMKKSFLAFLFLLFATVISGCEYTIDENAIYTTVYPVEFIIKYICEDDFNVYSSYPQGVDIHHYEPSLRDLTKIAKSKALFYIGQGLEPFVEKGINSTFKNKRVELINLSEAVHKEMALSATTCEGIRCYAWMDESHDDDHHGHGHFYDPHIWLSPKRVKVMAKVIKDRLLTFRPDDSEVDYEANFNALMAELDQLDQKMQSTINNADLDLIIVDHDAYQYWTKDYELNRIRMPQDTNPGEVKEIIDIAREKGIKHILVTQNEALNPNNETVLNQIGGSSLNIHAMAVLTKKDRDDKMNYFTLMDNNINTLAKALRLNN